MSFRVTVKHLLVFFGKVSTQFSCPFLTESLAFLLLNCVSYLHMLDINLFCVISFTNIVSYSVSHVFFLSIVSLSVQKSLRLIRSHLFIFVFILFVLGSITPQIDTCTLIVHSSTMHIGKCRNHRRHGFNPWIKKIPWRKAWQSTPVFLPGESRWTGGTVGLQFMALQRVGHNWVTKQQQMDRFNNLQRKREKMLA